MTTKEKLIYHFINQGIDKKRTKREVLDNFKTNFHFKGRTSVGIATVYNSLVKKGFLKVEKNVLSVVKTTENIF